MTEKKGLIPSNYIQVVETIENWQQAVWQASQPLLNDHRITTTYVDQMIESVQQNGPYMVLQDYFALMHARPGLGVIQQAISLLVSREPVDLEGKAVKIFLVLAAEDNFKHLQSLQAIMAIFMNPDNFELVLNGNKQSIIALFN